MTKPLAPLIGPTSRSTERRPLRWHRNALTHGAYSPSTYQPLADELAAALLASRLDLEAFPVALARWARAETRAALIALHIETVGFVDAKGEPRDRLVAMLNGFEKQARDAAKDLGLDPKSAADLAKGRNDAATTGWDAEAAFAKAHELDVERERRILEVETAEESDDAD